MTFKQAIQAVQQGAAVRRASWKGSLTVRMDARGDLRVSTPGYEDFSIPWITTDKSLKAEDWEVVSDDTSGRNTQQADDDDYVPLL